MAASPDRIRSYVVAKPATGMDYVTEEETQSKGQGQQKIHINNHLPEMAQNFTHRVGHTGRAGKRNVASTLFLSVQCTDLSQLERTIGNWMERTAKEIGLGDQGAARSQSIRRISKPSIIQLPGEYLHAYME